MSARQKLTVHDYNSQLPENLSFVQFNGSRVKSPLKCSLCEYQDSTWMICPRYGSKNTRCPKCKNVPNILEKESEKLPNNLKYTNYINSYTLAEYKCSLCNYTGTITPHKVTINTKCKQCKNTGLSKIDRLNDKLPNNLKYITYIDHITRATIQCGICKNTWEIIPKSISRYTKCKMCTDQLDEKEFNQFLQEHYLYSESSTRPKNKVTKHGFRCLLCKSKIFGSMKRIEKGSVCEYCNKNSKEYTAKRCQVFANKYNIKFVVRISENCEQRFIWTCEKNHETETSLAKIKHLIAERDHGMIDSWCDRCNNPNSRAPDIIAAEWGGKWIPGPSGYTRDDHHYKFECKNKHIFFCTIDDIKRKRRFCEECDGDDFRKIFTLDTTKVIIEVDPIISEIMSKIDLNCKMDPDTEKELDIEARRQDRQFKREDKKAFELERKWARSNIEQAKKEDEDFQREQDRRIFEMEYGTFEDETFEDGESNDE